ncbi:hypothetical protein BBJ28_00024570 [Nothophytophthora sp. Chile5]|nr:hypothetical protein BBJ28_00024570 [Nothophytophthora sp. Chile5]
MDRRSVAHGSPLAAPSPGSSPSPPRRWRWLPRLLLLGTGLYAALLLLWFARSFASLSAPSSGSPIANGPVIAAANGNTSSANAQLKSTKTQRLALEETHAQLVKALPMGESRQRRLRCIGWRATSDCSPFGPRDLARDQSCKRMVYNSDSGYCELEDEQSGERFRVMRRSCRSLRRSARFRCADALDFVGFRVKAMQAVEKASEPGFTLPHVGADQSHPNDGIAIVVYPKLVPSAYATIRALRDVLDCRLPIEIWYCPQELPSIPGPLLPLKQLADSDGKITFQQIKDPRAIGFGAKVYAIYHSSFDRVLFLDADNVPVRDPSVLFDATEFKETGAVFWPDFWHPKHTIFNIHEDSMLWELLDMPFVDMFEQESGQLLVDRRRHAAPLELVFFYMFHRPNHFETLRVAHGDKDLFRLAWLKLKAPFHMIQAPPAIAGKLIDSSFCGMTMVQHDAQGGVLFLHRNQLKLLGKPADLKKREAMESDGYPDPIIWTHLLSFRNTSRLEQYVIDTYSAEPEFPKAQSCYGQRELGKNPLFVTQEISHSSFAGLETHMRRFAMEAADIMVQVAGTHSDG